MILFKKGLILIMALSLFASLFGCFHNNPQTSPTVPEFPFDTAKSYYYRRRGAIAGGNCILSVEPQGIVEHYSYVEYPSEHECGMKDKGADIYFVGLKEGEVKVTLEYQYPTTDSYFVEFVLLVDETLKVTKVE